MLQLNQIISLLKQSEPCYVTSPDTAKLVTPSGILPGTSPAVSPATTPATPPGSSPSSSPSTPPGIHSTIKQSPPLLSHRKGPPPPVPTFPPHLTLYLHRNKTPPQPPPSQPQFYAIDPVVIPDPSPRESENKQTPWGPLIRPKGVSSRITADTVSTEQTHIPVHRFTVPHQDQGQRQGLTIPSPPLQEQRISDTSSQFSKELREIVGELRMSDVEATLSDDVRVSDILRPSLIDDMIDDMMEL